MAEQSRAPPPPPPPPVHPGKRTVSGESPLRHQPYDVATSSGSSSTFTATDSSVNVEPIITETNASSTRFGHEFPDDASFGRFNASSELLKQRIMRARRRSVNTFTANYGHNASWPSPRARQSRSASVPDFRFPGEPQGENMRVAEKNRNPAAATALGVISQLYFTAQNSTDGTASMSTDEIVALGRSIQLALHAVSDPTSVERTILNSAETDDPLVQQYLLDSFTPSSGSSWSQRAHAGSYRSLGQDYLDRAAKYASLPTEVSQQINEATKKLKSLELAAGRRDSAPSTVPLARSSKSHHAVRQQSIPAGQRGSFTHGEGSENHRSFTVQHDNRNQQKKVVPPDPLGQISFAAHKILDRVESWEFNVFQLREAAPGRPLRLTAWQCISTENLCSQLELDKVQVQKFIAAVEDCYLDNPYHNSTHVADVTQTVYALTKRGDVHQWMTPLQQYIMLISAAIHDVGHPGVNNAFLVSTSHPLAITYNDSSPLENMHVALAFRIMQCNGFDALSGLSGEQRWSFRSNAIRIVLGTDNASHFKNLADLTQKIDSWVTPSNQAFCSVVSEGSPSGEASPRRGSQDVKSPVNRQGSRLAHKRGSTPELSRSSMTSQDSGCGENSNEAVGALLHDESGQELVMQIMLHAADVSNPTKPWDIYLQWVDWLLTEYYRQGDMERERGLEVTPMLDREHPIPLPKFQMGFLKAIVFPLFEELGRVPTVDVSEPLNYLQNNMDEWQRRLNESSESSRS
eukprot:gb/GECG01005443.1/.p1 GENE.gb/GECG01005443.1/~~gb/GECG01005443.1/.p1  ORF type:complete len:746 (+),score=71.57 gb/GECG01005443.1/:1-2238(+)